MTDGPLVSVVVPTYRRPGRLRAAVESALTQDHDPVEVIVVDGSADGTARPVVESFDGPVTYIHQDEDEGPQAARSEGVAVADGEWIDFLDDDDRFHPAKIGRQIRRAEATGAGVVYCGAEWENGHRILPDPRIQGDVLEYALRFQMTPASPSAMLIDADVIADLLPFANRHGADDMGMKIELARRTRFAFVDEVLLTKGAGDASLGSSFENVEGRFELLDRYDDLYAAHPEARRVALAHTYLLRAEVRLDERLWSPMAVLDAARACWQVPGLPASFAGFLGASVFGRPGRDLGRAVYDRFLLGRQHRGKVT